MLKKSIRNNIKKGKSLFNHIFHQKIKIILKLKKINKFSIKFSLETYNRIVLPQNHPA